LECINKLKADKCSGTLIVPKWESASFWPLLVDNFGNFVTFIKGVYVLPVTEAVNNGRGNNGIFSKEPFSFRMLALRCDCRS
jgi:hypothetical protein